MKFFLKVLFILSILFPTVGFAVETSLTEDRDIKTISLDTKEIEGKLKAGVVIGYPIGITAGYRFSNFFELNGILGSNYFDFSVGANGLFTLLNLKISHEKFPISVGPALYTHFGHHDGNDKHGKYDEYTKIDLLGIARGEYDFKEIPLNLFVEAGLGLQMYKFADFAGSFAIGVRYIF